MHPRWLLLSVLAVPLLFVERPIAATATLITRASAEVEPSSSAPAALDLHAQPEDAPARIHELAAEADPDIAARTLTRWLAEESARANADGSAGARGNVPNLIEALGAVGGDVAMTALAEALEDRSYDLALSTLIVQQLGAHAPPASLARFAARAENAPARDDLEIELREEAIAAADDSGRLAHLRRTP